VPQNLHYGRIEFPEPFKTRPIPPPQVNIYDEISTYRPEVGQPKKPLDEITITVNLVQNKKPTLDTLAEKKATYFGTRKESPHKRFDQSSQRSDVGNLTRKSRAFALSTNEDPFNDNNLFSDSSTRLTSDHDEAEKHLDLENFRKTKDFGDFQILTDSPVRKETKRKAKK